MMKKNVYFIHASHRYTRVMYFIWHLLPDMLKSHSGRNTAYALLRLRKPQDKFYMG